MNYSSESICILFMFCSSDNLHSICEFVVCCVSVLSVLVKVMLLLLYKHPKEKPEHIEYAHDKPEGLYVCICHIERNMLAHLRLCE